MQNPGLLKDFSNIGLMTEARRFSGFPKRQGYLTEAVDVRCAKRLELKAGDLISFSATDENTRATILALGADGGPGLAALGLTATGVLDLENFDSAPFISWAKGLGLTIAEWRSAEIELSNLAVLKTDAPISVWVVSTLSRQQLVEGLVKGVFSISVSRPEGIEAALPNPLGEVREEFTISRGTARSYKLWKDEFVQIIDVEGQQCSDFMAFRMKGLDRSEEWTIDSTATRSMVRRAYPGPGLFDKFFDCAMAPMLRVVQDTCGRHDTFGLACTARGYEERGFPGHLNCSDNISTAMDPYGVRKRPAWPAINFFWNTWVAPNTQHLLTEESYSRPGDYVVMQALDDLVCVSTACPDDLDPINGWNPTDVHVRIYGPDAPIRRAIAYRAKEDAPMSISRETAFHARTSALTQHYAPARDLWMPVSYPAVGTIGEYWACREKVTLQDMSPLRKYDIIGPDAERLLQHAMTKDISRLAQWRGLYGLMCDDTGAVIDDGTLFRLAPELFRWCCGSEESVRTLEALVDSKGFNVRLHDMSNALVNVALQGPRSRETLEKLVFTQPIVPSLQQMKWFGVTIARLNNREGAPFMLSRTGYTGELGYELFCAPADASVLWDALSAAGAEFGLTPMGSAALDIVRIEAGLAAAGAEFTAGCDAFEAGLGFAIDLRKTDFVGKAALSRNVESPRRMLKGLLLNCDEVPLHGAPVFAGERQIGQVTSATRSPSLERGIAMARLSVEHAAPGTALEIGAMDGHLKRLPCTVCDIPFFDPNRARARA